MLAELFRQKGWRVVASDEAADVVVVNSCTVTARSEAKVRQAVRRIARQNPRSAIAVVGCAAQLAPGAYRELPNVRWVFGVDSKFELIDWVDRCETVRTDPEERSYHSPAAARLGSRTRAFVKIQDGCRFRCSYCAVPLARGRSRSAPPEVVLRQVRELVERGCREVVLTGVDIGSYGLDLQPKRSLAWLLCQLAEVASGCRVRLSSVEPTELTDELIRTVAEPPWVCNHWHVPLQSGSDRVLRAMRRPYTSAAFLKRIERLLDAFDKTGLGTDVIVGFPGESEEDFSRTLELFERIPFTYAHVFPYSPRPGTAAAALQDDVPKSVKEDRSRALRELATRKKREFLSRFVGSEVVVLVEGRHRLGQLTGLTEHYARVVFDGPAGLANQFVTLRIESVVDDVLRGRLLSAPKGHLSAQGPGSLAGGEQISSAARKVRAQP